MNIKRVITAGLAAGATFYVVSLVVWGLLKFLPVIPLAIAIPPVGLGQGWWIYHLLVSVFIGIMWAVGYSVYGKGRAGGWLYGATVYIVGSLPAFVTHFLIAPTIPDAPVRSLIVYGAIVSLIGALLGGRVISLLIKR